MRFFSQRAGSDVGVSAKLSPLPCFPQDNHKDPFGFKGLLLITSERKQPKNKKTKKKTEKANSDNKYREVTNLKKSFKVPTALVSRL